MKGQPFGFLLLFLAFLSTASANGQELCFEPKDADPYVRFAHKTAYTFSFVPKFKPVPYCRPTFLWMTIRHGTSYPNSNETLAIRQLHQFRDKVIKNHEERRNGYLCKSVLDSLKNWEFEVNPDSEDDISPQGRMDMDLMAKRTKDNMREVFTKEINQNEYKIYSSEDRKVLRSAEQFAKTMFGDNYQNKVPIESVPANSSFIGYESCDKWPGDFKVSEAETFQRTTEYRKMVSELSNRLGFLDDIPDNIVQTMYESCRYNKALVLESYPAWCAIFTVEELKFLEYSEDLEFFYRYGYGSPLNKKVGCPIGREVMAYFDSAAKVEPDTPSAVFRFVSSAGLLTTLTALGIRKDDAAPLYNFNYNSQYHRQWRMSHVNPFAGNLAAVFYKCEQTNEENKVMFYLNEGVYDYPGCSVGLCSWKYIEKQLKQYVEPNGCHDICHEEIRASGVQGPAFVTTALLITTTMLAFMMQV